MELKNYLHYYLRSNLTVVLKINGEDTLGELMGYDAYANHWIIRTDKIFQPKVYVEIDKTNHIKPILKRSDDIYSDPAPALSFDYMLKCQYDIFGLIDAGLAIDFNNYFSENLSA